MEHDRDIREADREKNNNRLNMIGRVQGMMGSISSMMNAGSTEYRLNQNYKHRLDDAKLKYNKSVEEAHRRVNDAVENANRQYQDGQTRARNI
jgi:hypothetical protein